MVQFNEWFFLLFFIKKRKKKGFVNIDELGFIKNFYFNYKQKMENEELLVLVLLIFFKN